MELVIKLDTYLKVWVNQSKELGIGDKVFIKKGEILDIEDHRIVERTGHLRVDLVKEIEGRRRWYVYAPHIEVNGNYKDNSPKEEAPVIISPPAPVIKSVSTPVVSRGKRIVLPHYGERYTNDRIIEGGNFSWGEATKGGTRIPVNKQVVGNIIKIARVMEEVRSYLGNRPITVTSWYRDPRTNRAVGGASHSRHILGDGVDFQVKGVHPSEVYSKLNNWWGSRGGLASSNSFTHIDARGYKARWTY
jgi:hypothetical protein